MIGEELVRIELADSAYKDKDQPDERVVCDLISSMTDRYALNLYAAIFFPSPFV